ncbi:replication protein [Leuconostoc mesenteroides subsp. dextranicum]|uniref:DUF1351 domain-containing protein n=1 Tax=Leuconostoc mesenteroides TaxID=1245 RepID=UPI00068106D1|nr:DUF1351 domain-containing protein [Leuconostoc mesenteroides]KMY79558.1 replication protein [Leuconostoc mesenteroides subsp. dextranicum]
MANEVETISTFEFTNVVPAKVEAPGLDELVANTDAMLRKYREFPVVEENYDQAKKTRKELRDTVENIATTRKDTEKKILTQWSDIKAKIMGIEKSGKKADELMTKQMNVVEEARKEKRQQVITNEVTKIASDNGIDVSRIEFNPKWVNVTYKHGDMVAEIEAQITSLKKDDELKALQINQIEADAGNLAVESSPYVSMLDYRDLADIRSQMKRDIEIKKAKEEAKKEAQLEAERKQKEREENATKIGDKLVDDDGEVVTPVQKSEPEVFTRKLIVTGTREQLKAVAKFMTDNNIKFGGE